MRKYLMVTIFVSSFLVSALIDEFVTYYIDGVIDTQLFQKVVAQDVEDSDLSQIEILEVGEFHGDEVSEKAAGEWLGLYHFGNTFELLPSTVKVEIVRDEIVGEENEKTGKKVSIDRNEEPILLIRGGRFIGSHSVRFVFFGREFLNNSFNESFEFNGQRSILQVVSAKPEKENLDYLDESSTLVLIENGIKQELYSQDRCNDCFWELIWVGDLDGDAKLDFYLKLSSHYNVKIWRLFLSGSSENGKLVKEVATFRIVGC